VLPNLASWTCAARRKRRPNWQATGKS